MNRIVKSSSRSISSVVKATSLGKALLPPITRSRPPVQDIEDNANYEKQLIDALDKAHMVFSKGTIEGQKMSFVVLWIKKAANAELVRAVQDNDRYHEIEALRNHHASKMCVFLQRSVLKKLFDAVINSYEETVREEKAVAADGKLRQQSFHNKQLDKNVKETLYSALETAAAKQLATVGKHLNDLDRSDVKIKTVGQLLIDDQIRLQLFQAVGVENVPLPQLSDELLHGYLSDMAHHPSFTEVYVSKDVPDDVKVLFSVVANRFQKVAREYDPALALQGEAVYDGKRLLARKSEMGLLGGAEFP